jgi:hypothetical protein
MRDKCFVMANNSDGVVSQEEERCGSSRKGCADR